MGEACLSYWARSLDGVDVGGAIAERLSATPQYLVSADAGELERQVTAQLIADAYCDLRQASFPVTSASHQRLGDIGACERNSVGTSHLPKEGDAVWNDGLLTVDA